jgi:hypothetical protein
MDDHSSQKFHQILTELGDLHRLKSADYGLENDPFQNIRSSAGWGVEPWVGALVRGNDKLKRLQKVAQGGSLSNEGIIDSLNDLASYAIIARILFEEDHPLLYDSRGNQAAHIVYSEDAV